MEYPGDDEVLADPSAFYDQIVEIDLSKVEPHLNGPFTPDAATPISHMKAKGSSSFLIRLDLQSLYKKAWFSLSLRLSY